MPTQYQRAAERHPPFCGLCRVVWRRPASCAFFRGANFGQVLSLGRGARHRWHRIRGKSPAAPPRGGGAARARAGAAAGAPAGRGRRARRPAHGRRPGGGARGLLDRLLPRALDGARCERRLRGTRQAHGRDLRRGGGARRGGADRLPRRDRAGAAARCRRTSTRASRSRRACSRPCPARPRCAPRS